MESCARCDRLITRSPQDCEDGTPSWEHRGIYVCDDFHGHDEHGVFAPNHTPDEAQRLADDARWFVAYDGDDECYFDMPLDDWVVPNNPALTTERRMQDAYTSAQ